MGVISFIVTLPLQPLNGVLSLAELIQQRVEQEMHDPARARRALEELDEAREAGEITAEEEQQAQQEILEQLTARPRPEATQPGEE